LKKATRFDLLDHNQTNMFNVGHKREIEKCLAFSEFEIPISPTNICVYIMYG